MRQTTKRLNWALAGALVLMAYTCSKYNEHTSTPEFQRRAQIRMCQQNPDYRTDDYCAALLTDSWRQTIDLD